MENNSVSTAAAFIKIPKKFLLGVYLVIPILLFVFVIDHFFYENALLPYVGLSATALPLFILFFEMPHIVASLFGFFDKEYLSEYKRPLFFYLPIVLILFSVILFIDFDLGIACYLTFTAWHALRQQTGIALILGAGPGWLHTMWTLNSVIIASLVYVYLVLPKLMPFEFVSMLPIILLVGMLSLIVITAAKIFYSPAPTRLYIFLVSSLILSGYIFIMFGYIFFTFFAFRFVHDVTAFGFYATHDHNRNVKERKNFIYKLFKNIPVPIIVIVPVLGILLAYIIRAFAEGYQIGIAILLLFAVAHYYLESVMWKRNAPHRQYVRVG